MHSIQKLRSDLFLIEHELGRCNACAYLPHSTTVGGETFSGSLIHCKHPSNTKQIIVKLTNVTSDCESVGDPVEGIHVIQSHRNGLLSQQMASENEEWSATLEKDDIYKLCPNCGGQFQFKFPSFAMYVYLKPSTRSAEKMIVDNLARLLDSHTLSDLQFDVDGQVLTAHTQIVASASPVLATMFQNNSSRTVHIKETSAEVFRQFVQYLYTGNALLVKEKITNVISLFAVASRYGVDSLKEKCATCLASQLSVENAVGVLIAAHLHSDEKLYLATALFISKNSVAVCCLSDWACLTEEYPELCIQATQFMLKQLDAK